MKGTAPVLQMQGGQVCRGQEAEQGCRVGRINKLPAPSALAATAGVTSQLLRTLLPSPDKGPEPQQSREPLPGRLGLDDPSSCPYTGPRPPTAALHTSLPHILCSPPSSGLGHSGSRLAWHVSSLAVAPFSARNLVLRVRDLGSLNATQPGKPLLPLSTRELLFFKMILELPPQEALPGLRSSPAPQEGRGRHGMGLRSRLLACRDARHPRGGHPWALPAWAQCGSDGAGGRPGWHWAWQGAGRAWGRGAGATHRAQNKTAGFSEATAQDQWVTQD